MSGFCELSCGTTIVTLQVSIEALAIERTSGVANSTVTPTAISFSTSSAPAIDTWPCVPGVVLTCTP
ncbi:MAG: hypothetical protein ABL916_17525 [Burkholderiaceae bacterium]